MRDRKPRKLDRFNVVLLLRRLRALEQRTDRLFVERGWAA